MKILKKLLVFTMSVCMLFSCVACGEYNYGTGLPGGGGGGNNSSSGGGNSSGVSQAPTLDGDPTNDFTVTVTANGAPYSPRMDMVVYWSDMDSSAIFSAPLDENGVARIDGLDGDYRVTLSAVPNEYAYDPNAHIATNDAKNITLELYTLNMLTGGGTGIYDCYHFSKTGVYSAVIESADDAIYFEYAPDGSGTYTIESWMDVTADNINPYVDVYGGHSQYKYYMQTTNDGGAMGSYTINFVHTVQIAKENISSGGGQATYTFAVKAESKNNKYPITVTFAVKWNGDFELPQTGIPVVKSIAVPKLKEYNVDDHFYDLSEYTIAYPETIHEATGVKIFDDDMVKIGNDGFYHLYDETKYADNGGYGPILYANITSRSRFLDSFNSIEGNFTIGGVDYMHFIKGYTALSTYREAGNGTNGGSYYYCAADCPCHDPEVSELGWACTKDCTECAAGCNRILEELVNHEGYQGFANTEGLVAVTEELKEFLSAWCDKNSYFYDGTGQLEALGYQAEGGSGWLFACCYYEKKQ